MCSQSGSYSLHSDSELYFTQGDNRIGGKYWKAQYIEYVDATFTRRKRLSEAEAHLGILGRVKPSGMFWMGEGRRFSRHVHLRGMTLLLLPIFTSLYFHPLLLLVFFRPSHQGRGGRYPVSDLCQQSWQSLQHFAAWRGLWQGLWCSPQHRW